MRRMLPPAQLALPLLVFLLLPMTGQPAARAAIIAEIASDSAIRELLNYDEVTNGVDQTPMYALYRDDQLAVGNAPRIDAAYVSGLVFDLPVPAGQVVTRAELVLNVAVLFQNYGVSQPTEPVVVGAFCSDGSALTLADFDRPAIAAASVSLDNTKGNQGSYFGNPIAPVVLDVTAAVRQVAAGNAAGIDFTLTGLADRVDFSSNTDPTLAYRPTLIFETAAAVPEPASLALTGLGLFAVGLAARRRRSA